MNNFGFVKVAAASPMVKVADCIYNAEAIYNLINDAVEAKASIVVFPELCITAYTCGDLFNQQLLIEEAKQSLIWLCEKTKDLPILSIVGLPLAINNRLYNVAAVIGQGQIYGIVPKTFLANYGEFYEKRWFASARELKENSVFINGQHVTVARDFIFEGDGYKFAIELCEDVWTAIPPSSVHALHGAEIIFNLSASNETVGKYHYRKSLILQQSARCLAGYVYSSVSAGESTTDVVYSGCCMIAENGALLGETERYTFMNQLVVADIDVEHIKQERLRNKSFSTNEYEMLDDVEYINLNLFGENSNDLEKMRHASQPFVLSTPISKSPFVPVDETKLSEVCSEVLSIQVNGLARRMYHIGCVSTVIGISGGLDSTLALLVIVDAYDKRGIDRKYIHGVTMPGFGTSDRTYTNAIQLMEALGITIKEIPIRDAVIQHFKDIDHDIDKHDITYENSQARERTQILMDYANKVNGLVIGTGDLSELALGWCTYNGDHMSMYCVNGSVPKTLVRALVRWAAVNRHKEAVCNILLDIVDTPVSPELLPSAEKGKIAQITEDVVGPYILHDFFLYYILRFGFTPRKIYFLAVNAFKGDFTDAEILQWMRICYKRFFTQQFKRSCLPDGPKVGSVSLSPRGDWKMPSDASYELWMDEINNIEQHI